MIQKDYYSVNSFFLFCSFKWDLSSKTGGLFRVYLL